jgi:hypothetical protein
MAELEAAERHLNEALARLEAALARRLAATSAGGTSQALQAVRTERDALGQEVAGLRRECERLSAALREAERENRAIRELTANVARRLDGSIDELDRMLED